MQFGLFTEFEWMAGHSEQEAFCTSLAQVASKVGYESEAAFSRAFKRAFGTAPATWRRSMSHTASSPDSS